MKTLVGISIRQFIPASGMFVLLFLLLRAYEWFLLQGNIDGSDIVSLELSSLIFDVFFLCAVISLVLAFHLLISAVHPTTAYAVSSLIFTLFLLFDAAVIRYFSVTRVPLGADLFGYTIPDILTTVQSSGASVVSVVMLIVVIIPAMMSFFFRLKSMLFVKRLSLTACSCIAVGFFFAWLLPHHPAPQRFERDLDYFIAVNKAQFLLAHTLEYAREHIQVQQPAENHDPLMHPLNSPDQLGRYLRRAETPPNIVFIIVEGLGRDFSGPDAVYGGFTPYLDSLSEVSLYWENFLSNAGRTFGALPSILGSLPYGREGFMALGNKMPDHHTLVSLLKPYGYSSNFFYGGNPNFDNQDIFLEHQGFDKTINQSNFPPSPGTDKELLASWGYPDRDVFAYASHVLQGSASPRIDVYLTLSTHEPFIAPDTMYNRLFESRLRGLNWNGDKQKTATENKGIFSCLLYTDNAIRELMQSYSLRPDFGNTIFIITGDHRLIPIPEASRIDRYHVPLIVYSPLLKEPKSFLSLSTHSDITPSILSMLSTGYSLGFPPEVTFLSQPLSTGASFSGDRDVALIRSKNTTEDYLYGEYFLSGDRLFKILPGLQLQPEDNDDVKKKIRQKLAGFKTKSIAALEGNHLYGALKERKSLPFRLSAKDEEIVSAMGWASLNPDQKFETARSIAAERRYAECRILLKVILNASPNYHDARILMARTYAWNQEYDSAILFLNQTLERSPSYADAFCALADIESWRGDPRRSLEVVNEGLASNGSDTELLARKARALSRLNRKKEAGEIIGEILRQRPDQELAAELQRELNSQ